MADAADAAEDIATPEQIAEYESQLAGINELLEASPSDESLLELKRDMEQLLELSKANLASQQQQGQGAAATTTTTTSSEGGSTSLDDLPLPPPPASAAADTSAVPASFANDFASLQADADATNKAMESGAAAAAAAMPDETVAAAAKPKKKLKKEKVEDFVLPEHLIPNEADTEAERNKKRRAAKALKSKWRAHKKEVESNNKQKSWQSFQKKTKRKSNNAADGSIFSTKEGVSDRVGVVSKKQMTDFGERKRHKHM